MKYSMSGVGVLTTEKFSSKLTFRNFNTESFQAEPIRPLPCKLYHFFTDFSNSGVLVLSRVEDLFDHWGGRGDYQSLETMV